MALTKVDISMLEDITAGTKLVATAPSTSGNVLTSDGTNWTSAAAAAGGVDGITSAANTTAISIDSTERVTMPLQTSFYARRTSSMVDVTGTNATYVITVIFDVEIWDNGGNYNTSDGVFTAPVAGKYVFASYVYMNGWTSSNTAATFQFSTSNREHRCVQFPPIGATGSSFSVGGTCVADMDASDTCRVKSGVSGSNQGVDIYADTNASNGYTWFTGWLLG